MSSPFLICREGEPLPAALTGAVAAIGNFDGLHRGHQHLIAIAGEQAERDGRPSAAVTFEPHPRDFFDPGGHLFRLTPEPVKLDLLAKLGLAGAFVLRFDGALACRSAEAFVADLLVKRLRLSGVVVGHDFHFGQGREGSPAVLHDLARRYGLTSTEVPVVSDGERIVSSSRIRSALERGDVATANALLGYRWLVRSEVRHGDKRGRTLGYPTANLRLDDHCRLRHGIYAVRVKVGGQVHGGVASFGRRPTFDNGAPLLEVFLFDFSGDLYGQVVDVEILGWIRGEERFASAEALVERMDDDSRRAKAMLAEDRVRSMLD